MYFTQNTLGQMMGELRLRFAFLNWTTRDKRAHFRIVRCHRRAHAVAMPRRRCGKDFRFRNSHFQFSATPVYHVLFLANPTPFHVRSPARNQTPIGIGHYFAATPVVKGAGMAKRQHVEDKESVTKAQPGSFFSPRGNVMLGPKTNRVHFVCLDNLKRKVA